MPDMNYWLGRKYGAIDTQANAEMMKAQGVNTEAIAKAGYYDALAGAAGTRPSAGGMKAPGGVMFKGTAPQIAQRLGITNPGEATPTRGGMPMSAGAAGGAVGSGYSQELIDEELRRIGGYGNQEY